MNKNVMEINRNNMDRSFKYCIYVGSNVMRYEKKKNEKEEKGRMK